MVMDLAQNQVAVDAELNGKEAAVQVQVHPYPPERRHPGEYISAEFEVFSVTPEVAQKLQLLLPGIQSKCEGGTEHEGAGDEMKKLAAPYCPARHGKRIEIK